MMWSKRASFLFLVVSVSCFRFWQIHETKKSPIKIISNTTHSSKIISGFSSEPFEYHWDKNRGHHLVIENTSSKNMTLTFRHNGKRVGKVRTGEKKTALLPDRYGKGMIWSLLINEKGEVIPENGRLRVEQRLYVYVDNGHLRPGQKATIYIIPQYHYLPKITQSRVSSLLEIFSGQQNKKNLLGSYKANFTIQEGCPRGAYKNDCIFEKYYLDTKRDLTITQVSSASRSLLTENSSYALGITYRIKNNSKLTVALSGDRPYVFLPRKNGRINLFDSPTSKFDYLFTQGKDYFALNLKFAKKSLAPGEETTAILLPHYNNLPENFFEGDRLLVQTLFRYKIIKDSRGGPIDDDHLPFYIGANNATMATFEIPGHLTKNAPLRHSRDKKDKVWNVPVVEKNLNHVAGRF